MDRAARRPGRRGRGAGRRQGRGPAAARWRSAPGCRPGSWSRTAAFAAAVARAGGTDRGAAARAARRTRPWTPSRRPRAARAPATRSGSAAQATCPPRRRRRLRWTRVAAPPLRPNGGAWATAAVRGRASPCGRGREDAADASYAGEHDTYLDVVGADAVADAVVACWASLYTARAVAYRGTARAGAMAVVVQRMVAGPRGRGVHDPQPGQRRPRHVRLRGGLGAGRAAGLRRGDARTGSR